MAPMRKAPKNWENTCCAGTGLSIRSWGWVACMVGYTLNVYLTEKSLTVSSPAGPVETRYVHSRSICSPSAETVCRVERRRQNRSIVQNVVAEVGQPPLHLRRRRLIVGRRTLMEHAGT